MPRKKPHPRRAPRARRFTRKPLSYWWFFLATLLGIALYFGSSYLRAQLFTPGQVALLTEDAGNGVIITQTPGQEAHGTGATVTDTKTGKRTKVVIKPGETIDTAIARTTKEVATPITPVSSNPPTITNDTSSVCLRKGGDYDVETGLCTIIPTPTIPVVPPPGPSNPDTNPESSTKDPSCLLGKTSAAGAEQWAQMGDGTCRQCLEGDLSSAASQATQTSCTSPGVTPIATQDQIDEGAPSNCTKVVDGVTVFYAATTLLDGTSICNEEGKFVAAEEYVPPATVTTTTTTNPITGVTTVTSTTTNPTTGATTTTTTTYLQTDAQWSSTVVAGVDGCKTCASYDNNGKCTKYTTSQTWVATIGNSGCGPTAVTNMSNSYAGTNLTPDQTVSQYYSSSDWGCGGTGSSSNIRALESIGFNTVASRTTDPSLNSLYNVPTVASSGEVLFMGVGQGSNFDHWTTTDNWQTTGNTTTFEMHDSYFQDGDYNCQVTGPNDFSCIGTDNGNEVKLSTEGKNMYVLEPPE